MKKLFIVFAIIIQSSVGFAQTSITVPVNDRVYRAIDRLVAVGIVDNVIIGQRPFTAGEVARILIEAGENSERLTDPVEKMMVYRLLKYWKDAFADQVEKLEKGGPGRWKMHFLDAISVSYDYVSGPDRGLFDNGLGTVNEAVFPLTEYSDGRHYTDGHNFSYESDHWLEGPYFVLLVHPRFQFQFVSDDREPENEAFIHQLYGRFGWRNFELEIGRDEVAWGQGENGGLMFSTNDRPLGFIKISNAHPAKLPWILSRLGEVKGTILLSNFGPNHNYPYTYMSAWKFSILPSKLAEIGFYYSFIIGGDGAPNLNAGDVARSFFGFVPRVSKMGISDQVGGLDFRFRIPPAWNMELYGELYFQNPDLSHPGVMFGERAAYLGGIYLPRLSNSHNMALRFEYRHTSPIIYRSFVWPDGFSIGGEVFGDPLGPAGNGVYASYYYDLGVSALFTARFAYERRGGNFYALNSDGGYSVVAGRPTEQRYRGLFSLQHEMGKVVTVKWLFGYEKTQNFNFVSGDSRNSFIGGINLNFDIGL
jgi:hypothetical protein